MMPLRTRGRLLRLISVCILAASRVSILLAALVLVFVFLRPHPPLQSQYGAWKTAKWIGFAAGFAALLSLALIDALGRGLPVYGVMRRELRKQRYAWTTQILGVAGLLLILLFAIGVLPSPKAVDLVQSGWTATSAFGPSQQVSSSAAAAYLLEDLRLASLVAIAIALEFESVSRRFLRAMRDAERETELA